MTDAHPSFDGGCERRGVRYRMASAPLIVHACHCRTSDAPAFGEP